MISDQPTVTYTSNGTLRYSNDADGRRTEVHDTYVRLGLPAATTSNATYDLNNELTSWSGTPATYDPNGNLRPREGT